MAIFDSDERSRRFGPAPKPIALFAAGRLLTTTTIVIGFISDDKGQVE